MLVSGGNLPLDEIPAGKVKDYLMASAACFPALRAREIDGVKFLDGGYSDNMPTGLAKRMNIENREAKQIIEDYFRTYL